MTAEKVPFWREPWKLQAPAFEIADGLYYVGNSNVSAHLLRTSEALVLIDTAFAETSYLLTESIRQAGYDPADIDLIIHSHGHIDHCGATRRMQELSGAEIAMGAPDVETVEQGTKYTCAEALYGMDNFEAFSVDRQLRHGDVIDCGDTQIQCHLTPGHTPGVITYTLEVEVDGERMLAGMFGGPGMWTLTDQYREDQGYPENREDFGRSLEYLRGLPVQMWLGAHPGQNDTLGKYERLAGGESPSPFVDADGWLAWVEKMQRDFADLLERSEDQ